MSALKEDNYGLPELKAFIREELKLNPDDPFPVTMDRQIAKYVLNDGFSYKEIGRGIFYYIEIKKGTYNDLYGIWFVGKYRKESARYWAELERKQEERRQDAKKFETKGDTVVFNVRQILKGRKKPYRLEPLKFDDIGEGGDGDNGHK